jgi:hypothetical protein
MDASADNLPSKSGPTLRQELDELYVLLRGAVYANSITAAKAAFAAKDYAEALRLVRTTGDLHRRANLQLVQQDPDKVGRNKQEAEKIRAKQEKLSGTLTLFSDAVQQLEKLAKVQPEKPPAPPPPKRELVEEPPAILSDEFIDKFQSAFDEKEQFHAVCGFFNTRSVATEKDIHIGDLYCLRHQGQILLLRCAKRESSPPTVTLEPAMPGRPIKPIALEKLLEFGTTQQLTRLQAKRRIDSGDEPDAEEDYTVAIINKGSFTQLQMAVQSSGLMHNADAIGFIRDHEFRIKKYQECFDRVEGFFVQMRSAAEHRMSKLRQEETNYRSGSLKMSPKEWLVKQQRETAQTQRIDRALRFFTKVLDGLRLIQITPDATANEKSEGEE